MAALPIQPAVELPSIHVQTRQELAPNEFQCLHQVSVGELIAERPGIAP